MRMDVWQRPEKARELEESQEATPPCQTMDFLNCSASEDHERQSARRAFGLLSDIQRAVLTRYYLRQESDEAICAAEGLTYDQFKEIKSKARKKMQRASVRPSVGCFAGCA